MTTLAYVEDFGAVAAEAELPTPAWLERVRRAAIARFEALGFPTPKNEDWHFTSVAQIAEAEFRALRVVDHDVTRDELVPFAFGATDWPTMVFVNGRFAPELSSLDSIPEGVRVLDLRRALAEEPAFLEAHLTQHAGFEENAFTALNTALFWEGAVVHVAKDADIAAPIHLLHVIDANGAKGVSHPRVLVVAERQSRATVIESHVALTDANYFTNAVTEIVVGEGATLRHYKLQREGARAFHVGTIEAHQARDSHFVSFSLAIGAALSRTNVYTILEGEGCGATLNGLYMLDGEQHGDHQTRIEHVAPNCFSREVYKGVLDGRSHGVFNGKVYVHPEAQKTDGKQSNNNLLLSDGARIDTKPQLEIFADDVKCTHGATVGRIDATALFYMKSRGLNPELARQLLTYAFAADVLEQIEVEEVKEELERMTLARFTVGEE